MLSEPAETLNWDIVDYLQTEEDRAAYWIAVLKDGDPILIAAAVNDITRATSSPSNS